MKRPSLFGFGFPLTSTATSGNALSPLATPSPSPASPAHPPPRLHHRSFIQLPIIPPPERPSSWIWRCHHCHSRYRLGVTRRCLEDGHYFCSVPVVPPTPSPVISPVASTSDNTSSASVEDGTSSQQQQHGNEEREKAKKEQKKQKRTRKRKAVGCTSEFDYSGWEATNIWRREVRALSVPDFVSSASGDTVTRGNDNRGRHGGDSDDHRDLGIRGRLEVRSCEWDCDFPSECRQEKEFERRLRRLLRRGGGEPDTGATGESKGRAGVRVQDATTADEFVYNLEPQEQQISLESPGNPDSLQTLTLGRRQDVEASLSPVEEEMKKLEEEISTAEIVTSEDVAADTSLETVLTAGIQAVERIEKSPPITVDGTVEGRESDDDVRPMEGFEFTTSSAASESSETSGASPTSLILYASATSVSLSLTERPSPLTVDPQLRLKPAIPSASQSGYSSNDTILEPDTDSTSASEARPDIDTDMDLDIDIDIDGLGEQGAEAGMEHVRERRKSLDAGEPGSPLKGSFDERFEEEEAS